MQVEFLRSQIKAAHVKLRGNKWSLRFKLFCLQLHFKSPAAYRFLLHSFSMPSVRTLRRFVNNSVGEIQPGFNDNLFHVVGLRVKSLSVLDRQCALVFDEVSLKRQLVYDENVDRILGYSDDGQLVTHALVFMVRGLNRKWKQAVAFFFTHSIESTDMLSHPIPLCVKRLHSVGLCVRCLVCDQGATNVVAIKKLGFSESAPKLQLSDIATPIYVIFMYLIW
jgi:hypothetical protein